MIHRRRLVQQSSVTANSEAIPPLTTEPASSLNTLCYRLVALLCVLTPTSCGYDVVSWHSSELASGEISRTASELIYDEDGRCNVRDCASDMFLELGLGVTVAIIPKERLQLLPDGGVDVAVSSLRGTYQFCDVDIPFGQEPVLAECSGVLVAPDLVLTAGHCVDSAEQCASHYVVFNYAVNREGALMLRASDIFECGEVLAREVSEWGATEVYDHALLRLASEARRRRRVRVRTSPLETGESVVLLGNGQGLPTKIDEGVVISPGEKARDFFAAQIDNFEKGSGSPVFDLDGRLLGIAVRGGVDYDTKDTCYRIRRVEGASGLSEHISYADTALRRASLSSGVDVPALDVILDELRDESVPLPTGGGCSMGIGDPCWPYSRFALAVGTVAFMRRWSQRRSGRSWM